MTLDSDALGTPRAGGLAGRGTLALSPWPMDFAAIAYGSSAVSVVLARNEGSLPVAVWSVVVEGAQAFRPLSPYGAVDGACAQQVGPSALQLPFVVGAGDAVCLGVVYEPVKPGKDEARLVLWAPPVGAASPLKSGQVLLKGTAVSSGAHLDVVPPGPLDFGPVPLGAAGVTRAVTLQNVGDRPLSVTGLELGANTDAGEFALVEPPPLPLLMAPGEATQVELRFVNAGGADGELGLGTLVLTSEAAPVTLPLRASRSTVGRCVLALDPPVVDFGSVAYTQTKTLMLTVKNVGTAACSPFSVTVLDAPSGADRSGACEVRVMPGTESKLITVVSEPPAVRDLLQPGQSATIELAFSPSTNPSQLGPETRFDALVSMVMLDYLSPEDGTDKQVLPVYAPPSPLGTKAACNLTGVGYLGDELLPEASQ